MDIWAVCEQRDGILDRTSHKVISEGRRLADMLGEEFCVVLLGGDDQKMTSELADYGADRYYFLQNELLDNRNAESYTIAICELVSSESPDMVLFGATPIGREVASRVAFCTGSAHFGDCVDIKKGADGDVRFIRAIFERRMYSTWRPNRETTQIVSVNLEETEAEACSKRDRRAPVIKFSPSIRPNDLRARSLEYIRGDPRTVRLEEAEIVVGVGRGLGVKENLQTIWEFADLIGGSIAGTRPVVDLGWIPFDRQVGQTGKTVRPKLYIACGISGAMQHTMGMKDADTIIAINIDRGAPIFKVADVKIVGDVLQVVSALNAQLNEFFGNHKT